MHAQVNENLEKIGDLLVTNFGVNGTNFERRLYY